MSFPRYERYKDSGVEWLGEVPEAWEVKALKYGYTVKLGKMLQPESKSPDDELLPYLRASNLQWAGVDLSDVKSMWFSPAEREQLSLLKDDLLVSEGGDVGRSAIWNGEISVCYFQNAINRVRSNHGNSTKFLYYWMSVVKDKGYVDVLCNKSTIAHFTAEKVQVIPVPFPPLPEQQTIAVFLDRETGKIDALVAEQERLIELLKEKRQAVISHAVTKGLDPDAPMKDFGIEWLGEVPEGWEVVQLKRDLTFLTSGSRGWAEHYADDGALFIRIGNLTRDSIRINLSDIQRVAIPDGTEGERTKVQSGDVLFSITAYLGSVAIAPENLESAYVSQHVALARLGQRYFLPEWVGYVTLSFVGKTYLETQGYGGTKNQLSLDDVANLIMTRPTIEEQSAIVTFLDAETAKIDTLVSEAQQAITLLNERRSALISAAVTGKIDVRGIA